VAKFQELKEDQWILIQDLMAWSPPKQRGKPRTHLKRVWNSIFWIIRLIGTSAHEDGKVAV